MSDYVLKQRDMLDEELKAKAAFKPGMTLYGYCGGRFGRDSYGDKVIQSIDGDRVTVIENGIAHMSFEIHSWIDLLNDSNYALEQQIAEESRTEE